MSRAYLKNKLNALRKQADQDITEEYNHRQWGWPEDMWEEWDSELEAELGAPGVQELNETLTWLDANAAAEREGLEVEPHYHFVSEVLGWPSPYDD